MQKPNAALPRCRTAAHILQIFIQKRVTCNNSSGSQGDRHDVTFSDFTGMQQPDASSLLKARGL